MKKLITMMMVFMLSVAFISCDNTTKTTTKDGITSTTTTTTKSTAPTTTQEIVTLDFYAMNDFHGGAYSSTDTLAYIGGYLSNAKTNNPNTIILSSGDMFQGTAFSNYYYGLPIIEAMNEMGFSSFTLGNHEFDWGVDKIANYSDQDESNGEATFPFLGANVVYTETQEMLPWLEAYQIVDIGGVKIGIVGVIGEVMNSISANRVTGITFLDPVDTIAKYTKILRTQEDCDVVIASIHDYSPQLNYQIALLSGDEYVDAVFNGHTHTSVADEITRDGMNMPYAQESNYSNSVLTKISLVYSNVDHKVTSVGSEVISLDQMSSESSDVRNILNVFQDDQVYQAFINEVLAEVKYDYDRYDLASWGASVIRDYMGLDFGMVNGGGFRTTMYKGTLTMGDLVVIYPFDNYIKTVTLSGADITNLYFNNYDIYFDDAITSSGGHIYKNGVLIEDNKMYTVGAVDYIFDKPENPFIYGDNVLQTTSLMRNLLAQDLLNTSGYFDPANGTSYVEPVAFFYQDMFQSILA